MSETDKMKAGVGLVVQNGQREGSMDQIIAILLCTAWFGFIAWLGRTTSAGNGMASGQGANFSHFPTSFNSSLGSGAVFGLSDSDDWSSSTSALFSSSIDSEHSDPFSDPFSNSICSNSCLNPATGLEMIGGMGGIDTGGHTFGSSGSGFSSIGTGIRGF